MAGESSKFGASAAGKAKAVGKILKGETGILRHLADEHGEVSVLMKRVAETSDARVREELFAEVYRNLMAHAKAEEQTFYPVLRRQPSLSPLVDKSLEEHRQVETWLDELKDADQSTATWKTEFERMMHAVEEHVRLEEEEIFPQAKDLLDAGERKDMLDRFEKAEQTVKGRL